MKPYWIFITCCIMGALTFAGCSKDDLRGGKKNAAIEEKSAEVTGYYSYAEVSVPLATTKLYVEYLQSSGTKADAKVQEVSVTPIPAELTDGKDAEPFGTVQLLFKSSVPTRVTVYASENQAGDKVYSLTDFPVDQVTSGELGQTRYVQMPWQFAFKMEGSTQVHTNPDDILFYDSAHDHTLRYIFCYEGPVSAAYYLEDAYIISDRKVTGEAYNYCGGCGNCPKCMPWGCSCGCGKTNTAFKASGNTVGGNAGGNVVPTVPGTVTTIELEEPASYITTDQDQTFYHSSGVVMFDDSWPSYPSAGGSIDSDYNDVVVDYDIEAKTVADAQLESQGWREQVKVVLHLRAVGGDNPARVGLVLEGFDQRFVDYTEHFVTLDSYQNEHGTLPSWVWTKIGQNCTHNEGNSTRPYVEMAGIFRMKEKVAGEAAGEYTYTNGGVSHKTVFNPGVDHYWAQPDASQYEDGIQKLANKYYYNTTPGYVNVAGGLITYTVIYHMKPRAEMSAEESQLSKQNMIDAVMNTTNQNFYIILTDWRPVGLKGYRPTDRDQSKYDTVYAANADHLDDEIPYYGKDGSFWAFKLPVLTRHAWEKYSFGLAYPKYTNFIATQGQEDKDWYLYPDQHYLTCWW